jgi:hypothetical protein
MIFAGAVRFFSGSQTPGMIMKTWSITHEGHRIEIRNSYFSEELLVDGELQDSQVGLAYRSRLYGRIRNQDGQDLQVKVSIGGVFSMECRIYIDCCEVFRS